MNLGTAVTFETGETWYPSITYLDDTHFVIAYADSDDSRKGKCVAGSISGTTATLGSIVEFGDSFVNGVSISMLDDTHFVIAYEYDSTGKCVVGSVSGTTITIGSAVTFETGDARDLSVCGMDATHFVIAYTDYDDSSKGKVVGASVSGTTISVGSIADFENIENGDYTSVCSLDSSHFVISYRQARAGNNYGRVICGTLSGNTVSISANSSTRFYSGNVYATQISALDSSKFIISYFDYDDALKRGFAIVGSVSGTTITITEDTGVAFSTGKIASSHQRIGIVCPNALQFLISYVDYGDSYKGKVVAGSISGTTITVTPGDAVTFESGSIGTSEYDTLGICVMGDYFGIAYVDVSDSDKGKVIIGRYSAIRSCAADISSSTSIAINGTSTLSGVLGISSIASLVGVGNFNTVGKCSIGIISSLDALGGIRTQGIASILVTSDVFAEWRTVGRCQIQSTSTMTSSCNATFSGILPITITSEVAANGISILDGIIAIGTTPSLVASGYKYKFGTVTINAVSAAEIDAIAYVAQLMGYTGTLTSGDVLVIDCDEQTVELNGANATRYFTGEFPQLYVGTNELRWKDNDASRDATLKTEHKPRYL